MPTKKNRKRAFKYEGGLAVLKKEHPLKILQHSNAKKLQQKATPFKF